MEDLQKSMTDLKALVEKMDATVSALAPLVPSVSALVALPTLVDALQKTMKEAGTHLESVSVAVKRMEAGDRPSESSSAKQKGSAGDGLMGAPPLQHHRPPPPPQTSFRVRVGRLHLRFVRRKAPSARRLWPRTGRPWRPWRRPQQGRLRGPLPTSARCWSMRGRRHQWPLRGRLRWQSWRASSSHRVPPPFRFAMQVSTASPRPQIAAMNRVTERAFPVGRDTELGLWWAKKAVVWPVGCHIS